MPYHIQVYMCVVSNWPWTKEEIRHQLIIYCAKERAKLGQQQKHPVLEFCSYFHCQHYTWKVDKLKQLSTHFHNYIVPVTNATNTVAGKAVDFIEVNFAHHWSNIREMVASLIMDLSRYQRVSATHIFVMMICNELLCLSCVVCALSLHYPSTN